MVKVKPLRRVGARGRYATDATGSRCRNLASGRWAKCDLCDACATKDGERVKRRARREK